MRNTEMLLPFEVVKEKRDEIVPRITEGCFELERIINYCIDSDIPTIACCAGHNLLDSPYISVHYNAATRKRINAFLNVLSDLNGIDIMFTTTGYTKNPFNVTIYTRRNNRDKVFQIIADSLEQNKESEYLTENLEMILNIAIDIDYQGNYANVKVYNRQLQKKYIIGLFDKQMKGNLFEESKSSEKYVKETNMHFYTYRNELQVKQVISDFENLHKKFQFRNGFYIETSIPTGEKVDRMSELNDSLMAEHETISRFRI